MLRDTLILAGTRAFMPLSHPCLTRVSPLSHPCLTPCLKPVSWISNRSHDLTPYAKPRKESRKLVVGKWGRNPRFLVFLSFLPSFPTHRH